MQKTTMNLLLVFKRKSSIDTLKEKLCFIQIQSARNLTHYILDLKKIIVSNLINTFVANTKYSSVTLPIDINTYFVFSVDKYLCMFNVHLAIAM